VRVSPQRLRAAAAKLARDEPGRAAIALLLDFVGEGAFGLDREARKELELLLRASGGRQAEVARQAMREALRRS